MFKIGEFSKLTGVSIRMLRHYDESGLLAPAQVDGQTGYRLYTAAQVADLQRILLLRDVGFSVKEMAQLLGDWSDEAVGQALSGRRQAIEAAMAAEQNKLRLLDRLWQDAKSGHSDQGATAVLKSIPAAKVLSLRRTLADHFDEHTLWEEIGQVAQREDWPIFENGGNFTIYHDKEHREQDVDVEVCVVTDFAAKDVGDIHFRTLPAVPYAASVMVAGPFENINPSYRRLAEWLEQHEGYQMLGTSRAATIKGPWNEPDPAQYLTEVLVPVSLKE